MTHVVGLLIIAFMLGRVFERWRSGGMDIEEEAYNAGYDDGLDEVDHRERIASSTPKGVL